MFSLIADEVTDISNKEILSLCVRYVSMSPKIQIKEIFIDFVQLDGITGEVIANAILHTLKNHRIDVTKCRMQFYDGATAMSSKKIGVQSRIKEHSPTALYTHCNSHVLNLSIAASCKMPSMRLAASCKMPSMRHIIDNVNEISLFFGNSPKRQRVFEAFIDQCAPSSKVKKLKSLCKTRWVERQFCFDTLYELFGSVCSTLEFILNPSSIEIEAVDLPVGWDRETRVKAGPRTASSSFLVAFITVKNVLEIIKPFTVKLLKRDIGIVSAFGLIDNTKEEVKALRSKIEDDFSVWFTDEQQLAVLANSSIEMPRVIVRQAHRAKAESSTTVLRNSSYTFL